MNATFMRVTAGSLVALLQLSVPGLAEPTLGTLSPEDNGNGRLEGFTFRWATAGVTTTVNPDTLEADAAAVLFSGKEFLGIEALHDRGYRSLGTVADVMSGDAVPAYPDGGSVASSSAFVATADDDNTQNAASAVPPSPGDPARAAAVSVVVPPPPDAASGPADGRKAIIAPAASLWSHQSDRPAAVSPMTPASGRAGPARIGPSPAGPSQVGRPSAGPKSAGPASVGPASNHEPPSPIQHASTSVFANRSAAKRLDPDAVRHWLLADLVARNQAFAPSGSTPSQPSVEDFPLAGSPVPDPAPPAVGAADSDPGAGSVVVLPVTPFPTLDTALDANVRVYANPNTGTAMVDRLWMALEALRKLTVPEIISIGLAASGLVGLAAVWRHRRRREALAYRTDP